MDIDWKKKLTSRKFWAAVCNFVAMLIVALGGSEQLSVQITGLIMAGATVIAYIISEGLVDAANAGIPELNVYPVQADEKEEEADG